MTNSDEITKLKSYLREIKNDNDIDLIVITCQDIYSLIMQSDFATVYKSKLQTFNEYFMTDCYDDNFRLLISKLARDYDSEDDFYLVHSLYVDAKLPVFWDYINANIDSIDRGSGLINAYITAYNQDFGIYKYIDYFRDDDTIKKNIAITNVDYFLFDMLCNKKFLDEYEPSIKVIEQIFAIDDSQRNPNNINILKIITVQIIKDCLDYLIYKINPSPNNKGQQYKNISPLNNTELQILSLRKNWKDINKKATHKNIGKCLNPPLSESNVNQKVLSIKNKLHATSIDDAIRIMEHKYGIKI